MLEQVKKLEDLHKKDQTVELRKRLNMEALKEKMIEVRQATKKIMFARQMFFKYWDKPSKNLARLLADVGRKPPVPLTMYKKEGIGVSTLEGKFFKKWIF